MYESVAHLHCTATRLLLHQSSVLEVLEQVRRQYTTKVRTCLGPVEAGIGKAPPVAWRQERWNTTLCQRLGATLGYLVGWLVPAYDLVRRHQPALFEEMVVQLGAYRVGQVVVAPPRRTVLGCANGTAFQVETCAAL